jgi:hypothetical protein
MEPLSNTYPSAAYDVSAELVSPKSLKWTRPSIVTFVTAKPLIEDLQLLPSRALPHG